VIHEGPSLALLERRVAETPDWIIRCDDPALPTPALVHDLLWQVKPHLHARNLVSFTGNPGRNSWYGITRILCWLLADRTFRACPLPLERLQALLHETAKALQATAAAPVYVSNAERREELIRVALAQLELRPAGETATQAQDRLAAVSSGERLRVIEAARLAEERAREIREALARKAAQEAADKWTRE